jgi:hypothetical protein
VADTHGGGNVALVVWDKHLTMARVRASIVYRLGAVPRSGGVPRRVDVDDELASLRGELDKKIEELEMLRLELDVNRSDSQRREPRLAELERRVDVQDAIIDEYLGGVQTMCLYLADMASRLRAS